MWGIPGAAAQSRRLHVTSIPLRPATVQPSLLGERVHVGSQTASESSMSSVARWRRRCGNYRFSSQTRRARLPDGCRCSASKGELCFLRHLARECKVTGWFSLLSAMCTPRCLVNFISVLQAYAMRMAPRVLIFSLCSHSALTSWWDSVFFGERREFWIRRAPPPKSERANTNR